jgi:flagellar assembly protein FliH
MYLINNAMRGIDNSHSFVISLSEGDYAYVNGHKEEIYGYLNPGVEISLFQDAALQKNQCKIETDNGLVDLSLDVQLSQLIKSLMLLNA